MKAGVWLERFIGFLLGVASSLLASTLHSWFQRRRIVALGESDLQD